MFASRLIHSQTLLPARKNFMRESSNREVTDKPKSADHFTHLAPVANTAGTMRQRENKQGSRVQAESKDGKNTTKLHFSTVHQCSSRNSDQQRLSQRLGTTASRRGGTPNTASRQGGTPNNRAREKVGSKTSRHGFRNITRHLNHFHRFASSWSLLNQRTKRCCVCRDFTAARCDHKTTRCI